MPKKLLKSFSYREIPPSRIATFDVFSVGLLKHHITALLEFDVTDSRDKLKELRLKGKKISFTAWLIKVISSTLQEHQEASAYLFSKKKLIIFKDIKVSIMVEKNIGDKKVPIPLVIDKTNEKSALEICQEIDRAKNQDLSQDDIVLERTPSFYERLYYHLPGTLRRAVWRMMLKNPKFAYKNMGNVLVTSVGMLGKINGWFIHRSVHPISFGIGSILKKPVVIADEIKIREILHVTILVDHDVIDGGPMVRFLDDLTKGIEGGKELNELMG